MGKYFYLSPQNEQQGPVDASQLKANGVTADTKVWTQGMPQWASASEVPELAPMFVPAPAPQPVPQPAPAPVPQPAPAYQPQPVTQPVTQPATQPATQPVTQPVTQPATQPAPATQPQPAGTYNKSEHVAPQPASSNTTVMPKPDNNLVWAILTTVMCCWPLGLYAIICANKVDSLYHAGNYQEAVQQAANAKKWSIIGAAAGGIFLFIYIIFLVIGAIAGS